MRNLHLPTITTLLAGLLVGLGLYPLPGSPLVISEILTQNSDGLTDEDGAHAEWIEIYNASANSQDLLGWSLTTAHELTPRWTFPATNLSSGGYLVLYASGKNRSRPGGPLHTSFSLLTDDGYLALLRPDGSIASELAYPRQRKNISFGVGRSAAASRLIGPLDEAKAWVPSSPALPENWTGGSEPFAEENWTPVRWGIGFDLSPAGSDGLLAYWDFNQNTNATLALDQGGQQHHGSLQAGAVYTPDRGGRTGRIGDRAVQFGAPGSNARIVVTDAAKGWFDAAKAKDAVTFSFWIYGSAAQPANSSAFWAAGGVAGSGTRSAQAHVPWSDGVIYWDTGGTDSTLHRVFVAEPDSTRYKGRWNHYVFLKDRARKEIWQNGRLILSGTSTAPLATIRSFYLGSGPEGLYNYSGVLDDFAIWSRGLLPEEISALSQGALPTTIGRARSRIVTDVASLMRGINASVYVRSQFALSSANLPSWLTLQMSYADGFIAYLNGTPVARRFAPETIAFDSTATTESPNGGAFATEAIDLSPFAGALHVGTNVLAIQGLNGSATDEEFLLEPTLLGGKTTERTYFPGPSPGQPNGPGHTGLLPKIEFSHQRGLYAEPFTLQVWVPEPGARLRYTLDGSEPTASNGLLAQGTNATLRIDRTTVLRMVADKEGYLAAPPITHSYLFPDQVASQRRPAFVGSAWPGGHPTDFEIDPRVVSSALPTRSFTNALTSIPTLSIATSPEKLFGAQGIYANSSYPKNPATDLEVPASAELIYPDGSVGFEENAGFQIHGNITRDKGFTPKHSFNLVFRKEYGVGKLRYPMFAESPVDSFDRFVLRAGSTDTWATVNWENSLVDGVQRWLRDEASFVRDQWVRDAQLDLGHPSARGTYVHLYLSGLYWGLYNLCEHPDDHFAADYLGGEREDYDVLADFAEVHAGDKTAWDQMNSLAGAGLASDSAYQRIQGNHPDGSRNPNFPRYLDVTNLVDYMILHVYIGADDWPNHNWWAARKRGADSTGFKFFAWDQEISISSLIRTRSSWGAVYAEADVPETPTFVFARCRANAEFRQLFADRIHQHLFNRGALTVASNLARWDARIQEIDAAVVAESARWGDYQRPTRPYTREVEWLSSNAWMRAVFFPSNQTVVMKRFRDAKLYPTVGAPSFNQFGGSVAPGFQLTLSHTNATGTLYLTQDGSDPRLRGGTISPQAESYSVPIPILERRTISARVRSGTNWSALVRAIFEPTQNFAPLQITEVMYHPLPDGPTAGDEFEFIELKNTGQQRLDLSGLSFTAGLAFTFTNGSLLESGSFAVIARNVTAFRQRYPNVVPYGEFDGRLADGGESLELRTAAGLPVLAFTYADDLPWPLTADGWGFSLVPREQEVNEPSLPGDARSWRPSSARHGSPGMDDPEDTRPAVLLSEFLANAGPAGDWIELVNHSPRPADLSGWLLTDDPATPAKYRIPANTIIPPGGFQVIAESEFGKPSPEGIAFGLSAVGDEVYLFSADAEGHLTGASHGFRFEASELGSSFVVHRNSTGHEFASKSSTATPGASNAALDIGPVVISEVHYHPSLDELEYLELHNITDQTIPLYEASNPTRRWQLRGLGFEFPHESSLAPGARCLIVMSEPDSFRRFYSVPPSVACYGPANGTLQDSGEELELIRPLTGTTNTQAFVVVDQVRYNDRAPWPPAADGGGPSLHRLAEHAFGDDAINWVAAKPTPGEGLPGGLPPRWLEPPNSTNVIEGTTFELTGKVESDSAPFYQWQRNGLSLPNATNATLGFIRVSPEDAGQYRLSAFNEAGALLSANVTLTVLRLPTIFGHPSNRALAAGGSSTLTVGAQGTGNLSYQWLLDGQELLGATNSTLRISSLSESSEGLYQARVTDSVGSTLSNPARVEILRRVSLVQAPQNLSVLEGTEVEVKVEAAGTLPIRYQWKRGLALLLNTNSMSRTSYLRLSQVGLSQAGSYSVTLANQLAGTIIAPFVLTVLPDTDRDGMPNDWEIQLGLNPNNSQDAGFDADGDGFTNRAEYQAGTDPRSAASRLSWSDITWDGQTLRLQFLAASNRSYSIFFTDALGAKPWFRLIDLSATSSTELRSIEDQHPGAARFYKLITPAGEP
ncbi:MAG: lamin tail domain-containing protein [Verrucomicrobiales bacterium]|nr:lamin tail domain-containing protein [Verrucomicrobiales bacterium]